MLEELKQELHHLLERYFPTARIESSERRGVIFEARASIDDCMFIEIYVNVATGKKSFALISNNNRIAGYDNYRFWHYHPPDRPSEHLPCEEPSADSILLDFKAIANKQLSSSGLCP